MPSPQPPISTSNTSPTNATHTGRLLVIANRLPISLKTHTDKHTGKTTISTTRSSGGLVSALQGM